MVTHASLILIFVGATVTYFFKVEGQLGLWEGESASIIEQHDSAGKLLVQRQLPFSVKLDDFVLETYPGLMRPAGFSSYIQITDRDSGRTFPAKIWMNHELTYRGYTLFQSSYQQAEVKRAAPPDVEMLADAILMTEKDRLRRQREKKADTVDSLDIGDLLVSGVELAWKYFRNSN